MTGGLVFLAVFSWRYYGIDHDLYQIRDDGVITMSHARNLIDYGFIGVSPSGDRVEGYSAPLQFLVYAITYAMFQTNYEVFSHAQTSIATFLLGALFILFFRDRWKLAIGLTILAALVLTQLTSFLLWHGSGMENAITHIALLATVLILFKFAQGGRIKYELAPIVFLASISRIDTIYHTAPLLVIFAGYWLFTFKNRQGCYFSAIVFAMWIGFNLWRYIYFGDITPNTAYAQGLTLDARLNVWENLSLEYIVRGLSQSRNLFSQHGGYLLLAASPLLLFVLFPGAKGTVTAKRRDLLLAALISSLIATACITPFLFGTARLDATRTSTQLAVFVVLAVAAIHYYIDNRRFIWIIPAVLVIGATVVWFIRVEPYYLCCRIDHFDSIRREFSNISREEALFRPTVSNPDLGVVSWHKQFNIVDLGKLGTPVMAKLSWPLLSDYFFELAGPDIIESHSAWSCRYDRPLFADPRFDAYYQPVDTRITDWTKDRCRSNPESLSGIWIRRDVLKSSDSQERTLINDLTAHLSITRLHQELDKCQSDPANSCVYVARAAYRFLPELRSDGRIQELNKIFSGSRTKDFDLYLINGYKDGQAHEDVINLLSHRFIKRVEGTIEFARHVLRSDYDVYIDQRRLIYTNRSCMSADNYRTPFFLHVVPVDSGNLPDHRKKYGFDNLDFRFADTGVRYRNTCVVVRELPEYEISQISTGQFKGKNRIWGGSFAVDD